jgi:hypothetical protein
MVKLLGGCFTILSSQTRASKYAHGLLFYRTVLLRVEVRRELEFAYARGRLLVFGIREGCPPQSASPGVTVMMTLF